MIKDIIKLIRVKQWYKNLLVFLPLVFGQQLFNFNLVFATFFGFVALCLISSSNYILNDIFDRKKDRINLEKKNRPIASGKISVKFAILLAILFFSGSIFIAINLSLIFLFFVTSLFTLTQFYTFKLKNIAFVDILTISINFVLRAVSGVFIVSQSLGERVGVSYWLILCPFFLALFLASSKRQAEVILLKDSAKAHRKVLNEYTKEITFGLMIISTTLLIISYSIYIMSSSYPQLIFTLPFVLYLIFSFFAYAEKGQDIARNPELIYRNKFLVLVVVLVLVLVLLSIYGVSSFKWFSFKFF